MGVSFNRSTENDNADSKVHTHVIIGDVPICHVFWHFSLLHIVTESSVFPSDNCFNLQSHFQTKSSVRSCQHPKVAYTQRASNRSPDIPCQVFQFNYDHGALYSSSKLKNGVFSSPSGHFSRVLRVQVGQDFSRLVRSLPTRVESSSLRGPWAALEPKT